jgi:hypothetical protein
MKTPYFIENIDWTDLRTQKTLLLETINNDAVSPEHKEGLEGILALIDALQDFAVDEMGISEMHVFDFELEDERSGMVAPELPDEKTKTVMLCHNCGSDNVQTKMWVNVNNDTISDSASDNDNGDNWCLDCETHPDLLPHTLKSDAKVVGFQVVGEDENEGEIHPEMDASFCLYNLSQAREMFKGYTKNWRLLTIWEGDIEEPTYMFEGDPRS